MESSVSAPGSLTAEPAEEGRVRDRSWEYSKLGPAWAPLFRRRDRSGLTVAERNAVILYHHGAREAAAKALGWTHYKQTTESLGTADQFIERKIGEIRDRINSRPRAQEEVDVNEEPEPERLDEREAEPAPPPGVDKLDERIEEVPPPPKRPPERAEEKDDAA